MSFNELNYNKTAFHKQADYLDATSWTVEHTLAIGPRNSYESLLWKSNPSVITHFLKELTRQDISAYYLDLFAGVGEAAEQLAMQHLIAGAISVDINDRRDPVAMEEQQGLGCYLLPGDLLKRATWHKIVTLAHNWPNFTGFNLITSSPVDGSPDVSLPIFASFLNRSENILSPHSGLMVQEIFSALVQSPLLRPQLIEWLEKEKHRRPDEFDYWVGDFNGAVKILHQ